MQQDKTTLRRAVRERRTARPPAERERLAGQLARVARELPPVRGAARLAAYAARAGEPGTAPLLDRLRGDGATVLLPVALPDRTLDWAVDDGRSAPAAFGVPEPLGERLGPTALRRCDVVLVPAVAVDTTGTRLGHGLGYYDRALQHVRSDALVLALVHDDELLDAAVTPIARADHDVPVHGVITPSRWMLFRR